MCLYVCVCSVKGTLLRFLFQAKIPNHKPFNQLSITSAINQHIVFFLIEIADYSVPLSPFLLKSVSPCFFWNNAGMLE